MDTIVFKRLEMDDIGYLKDILENTHMEYNINHLKNFISNQNNYGFIGIKDNKAIAFLYGYSLLRPDGRNMFYIHSVDVLPNYQGNGIGTKLMEYVLGYLKEQNIFYKFFVLAETDNTRACRLYQKFASRDNQVLFSYTI